MTTGMDGAPQDVRAIHALISASFHERGATMPRMTGMARCESTADAHIYEAFFELAPGVMLSTTYGSPEDIVGS